MPEPPDQPASPHPDEPPSASNRADDRPTAPAVPELSIEMAGFKAELRADLDHLGGIVRSELARIGSVLSNRLDGATESIGPTIERGQRALTRRLIAAQVAIAVITIVAVRWP